MKNNYIKSLNILLKENNLNSSILKIIKQRIYVLIKINNTIIKLLPIEVNSLCQVANYHKNILFLEVINASRKIRLSYELPMLFSALRNTILPSLSLIKIIINPSLSLQNSKNYLPIKKIAITPSKQIINKLSIKSAKIVLNLAKKSPQKLKEKLESLVNLEN
ncbi:MAG: hypothetical protein ArsCj_5210 [Arsenophonus endosymbiont of Ceratovacuna japonica]